MKKVSWSRKKIQVIREDGSDFLIQGTFNPNKVVMSLPEYPQNGMEVKVIDNSAGFAANSDTAK